MKKESVYDKMTETEREVATLLKNLGIFWNYEKPVYICDDNSRPRVWTPDFFLVQFGVYLEVCGSKDFDYEYRKKIFDRNGYKIIFLHLYKEPNKWKYHLIKYLEKIVNYRGLKISSITFN